MSYAILSLTLMALFHFIYESILAPSFRMKLRFELCALRDDLRRAQRRNSGAGEGCRDLEDSLSALISLLHRFDATTLAAIEQELRRNPELRRQVELRGQALRACRVPEVVEVRRRISQIATRAVLVNHGAWCVYLVPIVIACFSLNNMRRLIEASISLSRSDFLRIAPSTQEQTGYTH